MKKIFFMMLAIFLLSVGSTVSAQTNYNFVRVSAFGAQAGYGSNGA